MLKIVKFPHPSLLKKCQKVTDFNSDLTLLVDNMFLTMDGNDGIGLAANQVNVSKQLFVMNIDNKPQVFINPVILETSQNKISFKEGCLSFPLFSQETQRFESIKLKWQDINGNFFENTFDGISAICIQHEIDHLNGITFLDKLSGLKKNLAIKKYFKNLNIHKT